MKSIFNILGFIVLANSLFAQQDAMYTQYMFNKLLINPGFTGSMESISTTVLYRNQWVGFEGAPTNFTLSSHMPFKGDPVNLGLTISNDAIGVSQRTGIFANYAYRMDVDFAKIGFGLNAGFNLNRMKWDEVKTIDPNDAAFLLETKTLFLPNAGIGVFLENKDYFAGISMPRLFANKIDYTKNSVSTSRLSRHYYLMGGYNYEINRDIVLKPSMLLKFVGGAPLQLDLTVGALFHNAVYVGTTFRSGDAMAIMVNYQMNDMLVIGYAADFTYSSLSRYQEGTHEILIQYNYGRTKTFRSKY